MHPTRWVEIPETLNLGECVNMEVRLSVCVCVLCPRAYMHVYVCAHKHVRMYQQRKDSDEWNDVMTFKCPWKIYVSLWSCKHITFIFFKENLHIMVWMNGMVWYGTNSICISSLFGFTSSCLPVWTYFPPSQSCVPQCPKQVTMATGLYDDDDDHHHNDANFWCFSSSKSIASICRLSIHHFKRRKRIKREDTECWGVTPRAQESEKKRKEDMDRSRERGEAGCRVTLWIITHQQLKGG